MATSIDITGNVKQVLAELDSKLKSERINPVVGQASSNVVREYLFKYNETHPNKLGGKRTNFYSGAAKGTHYVTNSTGAIVSVNKQGIAQRYYGGTIKPVNKKWLTIPVNAMAYGKTASQLDLQFVREGNRAFLFGKPKGKAGKKADNNIMFILLKKVDQKGDKTVLPTNEAIETASIQAIRNYVARRNL